MTEETKYRKQTLALLVILIITVSVVVTVFAVSFNAAFHSEGYANLQKTVDKLRAGQAVYTHLDIWSGYLVENSTTVNIVIPEPFNNTVVYKVSVSMLGYYDGVYPLLYEDTNASQAYHWALDHVGNGNYSIEFHNLDLPGD